tara:strand:+ start:456 stop:1052 length:597 start_codon:yes stop_codon:yes gene_type:complete
MAITKGLSILCEDLQRTGGISQIFLRSWAAGDQATFVNTAGTSHSISSIVDTGGTDADWFMFEFKDEVPTLAVAATKENGSTAFECTLSFYLPRMNDTKFAVLQEMLTQCMMGIVVDTNGNNYVIGVSEKYSVGGSANASLSRSQTYLNLASMEGNTGAAYSEENGITITLMAKQFELPRLFTGVLTPDLVALTATTA